MAQKYLSDNEASSHALDARRQSPNTAMPPAGGPSFVQSSAQGSRTAHDARIISAQEQQRAFRSAQRHTQRVRWLKLGLPLIAFGIVAGFIGWVVQQKPAAPPSDLAVKDGDFQQEELVMKNPDLNGYTNGQAYNVIAKRATQKVATPDIINMEEPVARITDDKDQWVTITSKVGQFNQTTEFLEVKGNVDVKSSLGYNLKTEVVQVEMAKDYLQTLTPVQIRSKDIALDANKLEAFDNGDLFRFTGGVKLHIDAAMMNKNVQDKQAKREGAGQ